ncbi:PHD finger protein 20-like protein 1 isoform X2 [Montipora foliosa]|uniref:PHD finger protein 20-like protein 1 isoform X2 n=1 Tax=Montipora foliosa TaxID=591990 RepID=UPI0035F14507
MRIDNRVRMSTKQISPSSGKNKILYQAGARLEAMDYTLNWYAAKICRVDNKERKVLIHFEGWNHRYDEWINFDSERLRPHARQQSHQDSKDEKEVCDYQDWKVGDRVLAKWQDCKFYPAKVVKPLNDECHYLQTFKRALNKWTIYCLAMVSFLSTVVATLTQCHYPVKCI